MLQVTVEKDTKPRKRKESKTNIAPKLVKDAGMDSWYRTPLGLNLKNDSLGFYLYTSNSSARSRMNAWRTEGYRGP